MNGAAAALLDFWASHWWQLYAGALLAGLGSSIGIAIWFREPQWESRFRLVYHFLLSLGAGSMALAIALTVARHHDSPWESVCFLYDHHLGFFVDGSILPLLIVSALASANDPLRRSTVWKIWLDRKTTSAARLWIAVFYMACGINKFFTRETLDFFHSSGYGTGFFYFIAAWELAWGLALAWQRTWIAAIAALSCDMVGAICTHYHNYFSKGFTGPFENSLDALRMLLLMGYLVWACMRTATELAPIRNSATGQLAGK
jgi:hypothetical protein